MNTSPLHILIRTHNRPALFRRCIQTVLTQTVQPAWIIVCCQTEEDEKYVEPFCTAHNIISFIANPEEKTDYHYNLYCNQLKKMVTTGHFMFLDDDDFLVNSTAIERITPTLEQNKFHIVFVQMLRATRRKPTDFIFDRKLFKSGEIGLPCVICPAKYKGAADLTATDNGDYEWAAKLRKKVPAIFLKQVVVSSPQRNYGKS